MSYLAKQAIGSLLWPLTLSLLLAAMALLSWRRQRPKGARALLISAALVGYLGSTSLVGDALLRPLERRYRPLPQDAPLPQVQFVAVLGSDYSPHDDVPITAALDGDGLTRIVEGVRLLRRLGAAHLIVSGGAPSAQSPPALGYARLARELGIDPSSIVVLAAGLDTSAEAKGIAAVVGNAPFLLVTSAYHMPRAVWALQRAGAQPVPAPTGQLVHGLGAGYWREWLPNSAGLGKSERAMHEYAGLLVLAMTRG